MAHSYFQHIPHYLPFSEKFLQYEYKEKEETGLMLGLGMGKRYDEGTDTAFIGTSRYGQNPTGPLSMTCPIEMSMQENRYRRMLTPDVEMHVNRELYTTTSDDFGSSFYSPPVGNKLHPTSEIKWSDFYGKNKLYKAQTTGAIYTGNAINRKSNEQSYYFAGSKNVGVSKSGTTVTNYGGFVAPHLPIIQMLLHLQLLQLRVVHGEVILIILKQRRQVLVMRTNIFEIDVQTKLMVSMHIANMSRITHLVWYSTNPGFCLSLMVIQIFWCVI